MQIVLWVLLNERFRHGKAVKIHVLCNYQIEIGWEIGEWSGMYVMFMGGKDTKIDKLIDR